MKDRITLGVTTAGSVGAAVIAMREFAVQTEQQALSGTLACVMDALRAADIELDAVELLAVCTGPGSFTGLRIGVTLLKSIAQARNLPIVGVSSYEVAESGAREDQFPKVAIVAGKRDYYYARIRPAPNVEAAYLRGSLDEIRRGSGSVAFLQPILSAAEQAAAVARIGRRLAAAGADLDWRAVAIDYGQPPNAVINWEAGRHARERGGAPSAANLTPE